MIKKIVLLRSIRTIQVWSNHHLNFVVYDGKRWCSHVPGFSSNYVSRRTLKKHDNFENFMPTSLQLGWYMMENVGVHTFQVFHPITFRDEL